MVVTQKAKNIFNRLRRVLRIALEIRLVIIMLWGFDLSNP